MDRDKIIYLLPTVDIKYNDVKYNPELYKNTSGLYRISLEDFTKIVETTKSDLYPWLKYNGVNDPQIETVRQMYIKFLNQKAKLEQDLRMIKRSGEYSKYDAVLKEIGILYQNNILPIILYLMVAEHAKVSTIENVWKELSWVEDGRLYNSHPFKGTKDEETPEEDVERGENTPDNRVGEEETTTEEDKNVEEEVEEIPVEIPTDNSIVDRIVKEVYSVLKQEMANLATKKDIEEVTVSLPAKLKYVELELKVEETNSKLGKFIEHYEIDLSKASSIEKLEEELTNLRDENSRLTEDNNDLYDELKELKKNVEEDNSSEELKILMEKYNDLETENNLNKTRLKELQNEVALKAEEVANLTKRDQVVAMEQEKLGSDVRQLEEKIVQLEKENSLLKNENVILREANSVEQEKIDKLIPDQLKPAVEDNTVSDADGDKMSEEMSKLMQQVFNNEQKESTKDRAPGISKLDDYFAEFNSID